MKKIIIAGGTGFLGKALSRYFEGTEYDILLLSRTAHGRNHILWDGKTLGSWVKELEQTHALINLCGKSVDCRYTANNRDEILRSRIDSTRILQQAINACDSPPTIWLNASSATIYIHAENYIMTESKGLIGDDFSMTVCKKWEHEFFKQQSPHVRKVALRSSIVLGQNGGAFPKMKLITRLGLGGAQGDGTQFMSWIHSYDFCRAVHFIINNENMKGAINITAPNPIKNSTFMSTMRTAFSVLFGLPSPKVLLELVALFMGTETELLLKSRNVYPERLIEAGFKFDFPEIDGAIEVLTNKHWHNKKRIRSGILPRTAVVK